MRCVSVPTTRPRRLTMIKPRRPDIQYEADAAHGRLWILTNDDHVNFRVATPTRPAPANGRN